MRWGRASGRTFAALSLCLNALPLAYAQGSDGRAEKIVLSHASTPDVVAVYDTVQRSSKLPLSVSVLSADALAAIDLIHPSEALNRVAGVNIHRGSGQEHLTAIRSPVLTGGAGAGSFLYLEDGVPLRAAGFANVNGLFEAGTEFAASVDVFKGPGPATYGSNAVHGLVNVNSRRASGAWDRASLMGNGNGLFSISGAKALEAGFSAFLASASIVSDNGFRADSGFDQQKFQLKYDGLLGGGWYAQWLTSFQNLNQETAGFIQGVDAYKDDDLRFSNANPEAFRDAKSYRTQARFERDIGAGRLALTPYARRAETRFLRHFVPGQALEKNAHSSVGLQTAFYDDAVDGFNIGADVEFTQGDIYEFQANPDRFSYVQGLHYDYGVAAIVAAAYAETSFFVGEATVLEIGARAEYTDYHYKNNADSGRFGRFIREDSRRDDFLTFTPKINLKRDLSESAMVYARAARSSCAPQVSDLYSVQLNQVPGEADVETLDSLEAGFKFNRGNRTFEAAAFTMWKDNFFFRNANGFNVVNGKTRHTGLEVSFALPLTARISVSGDGTWARHTYDFTEIVGSPENDIVKGNRVDTAPDTLANMRVHYAVSGALSAEFEWRHMGAYFTDPGNTAHYPGHDIFVLRGAYNVNPDLKLKGRIDNLLDAKYADRADFAFGNERYFPGRPRTFFLGLAYGF